MRAIKSLAVLICVSVSLATAEDKSEIFFQLFRDYVIVVKGGVDGQSNLHFIVDTGAVPSVLDKRLMKNVKAVRTEKVSVFSKNMDLTLAETTNLSVGPWQQASLSVLISDLSFASEALGVHIDGMLGLDFFGTSFSIDYNNKKLRKLADAYEPAEEDLIIYHAPEALFATVQMNFDGRTLKLLADSGTSDLVFFKPRVQHCLGKMKTVGKATWSNIAGELSMQRVRLERASIAGQAWPDREALIMNASKGPQGLDGMLGLSSLNARRVVFIPPNLTPKVPVSQAASRP